MRKETAIERLTTVYNALYTKVDQYTDYIENGKQWQDAKDFNAVYLYKMNKINKLIQALETVTDKEDVIIQCKTETEKRWFGRYESKNTIYRIMVDNEILIEV